MALTNYRIALAACVVALSACASAPVDDRDVDKSNSSLPSGAIPDGKDPDAAVGTELCDLSAYAGLKGQNVAAVTLPASEKLRVFNVNDIVTRDYIPQRTNVVYEDGGVITQVYCG